MKHSIFHLTTLTLVALVMLWLPSEIIAQEAVNLLDGLRATSQTVATRQGAKAVVDFDLDLTNMKHLKSNTVLQVVPTLQANDGSEQLDLPAISISGRTRAIMLRRIGKQVDIIRNKSGEQHYHYTAEVPFALWMKDASLIFRAKGYGCAECELGDYTTLLGHGNIEQIPWGEDFISVLVDDNCYDSVAGVAISNHWVEETQTA